MQKSKEKALKSIKTIKDNDKLPQIVAKESMRALLIKRSTGRPRKYKSPQQMQNAISKYFTECLRLYEPCTITGLALWLGFTSRQDLINYEGYSDAFRDTIKRAKFFIENEYEKRLFYEGNPAGAIFALKNFDWKDKQETDITTKGQALKNVNIVSFAPVQNDKKIIDDTQTTPENDTLSGESLPDNSIGG